MNLFEWPPFWYLAPGLVISFYQAYRGFILQFQTARNQRKAEEDGGETFALGAQTKFQIWVVRALADGILYLVATLTGFIALWIAGRLLDRAPCPTEISAGASALFVFLVLYGVLGVTGQLPNLLQKTDSLLRLGKT